MSHRLKILVIGLDAATMDLIGPLIRAGELPNLRELMLQGASTRLRSTPNMHSASAWTSILTGLNPGRHGLFVFSDRDFATGEQIFYKGGDRTGETITGYLSRQRLTSGLLNVPMTYPAQCEPGGYTVSGLDAPELGALAFCPRGLQPELRGRFPGYRFTPDHLGDLMSAGKIDQAVTLWLEQIEAQTSAAEYLLETRPVDFFMTVYTASDWAGHNLWKDFYSKQADGQHREVEPGDPLSLIYRTLDEAVGRLVKLARESTQIYVLSDHGMGSHTRASYWLADWLEKHGYMARRVNRRVAVSVAEAGRRTAKRLLPGRLKDAIKSALGGGRLNRLQASEKDAFYSSIDWDRTLCYTEPGRHVVNVNLAGRNLKGIVALQDYDNLCRQLASDLRKWTDDRGVRVVDQIAHRSELYWGPFVDRASDLYIYWNTAASITRLPDEIRNRGHWWSGDHRLEGILICKGPGIARQKDAVVPTVYDLVPTILYLAGLKVPEGLDGRVVREICTEEFVSANALSSFGAPERGPAEQELSEAEKALIEDKLRSLGYL